LVFNNKIYDLHLCTWIDEFRYDDYISFTTGYDWIEKYPLEYKEEVYRLLRSIIVDDTIFNFCMNLCCLGLKGELNEYLLIFKGRGGNGKGVWNSLMEVALGNYCYKLASQILLKPIKEGGNPQVANMDSKRYVYCEEPDAKQQICCATIKELTGAKTLNTRLLNSNKTRIVLHSIFCLETNELPLLDKVDFDALYRRLIIIDFNQKFVPKQLYDSMDEDEKAMCHLANDKYKNEDYLKTIRQGMMMILLDHWTQYKERNFCILPIPKICESAVRSYIANSETLYQWILENYERFDSDQQLCDEKDISAHKYTYIDDIYSEYKCSDAYRYLSFDEKKTFTKKKFTEKIENIQFLRKDFRERKKVYIWNKEKNEKQQNSKPLLIYWERKNEDNIEDGNFIP
jgi:phage/plasmid-associated DNA primase